MENENDSMSNYIFSGMDDEGLTSNDMELMKYIYGELPLAPPLDVVWNAPPNDVRRTGREKEK